MQQHPPSCRTPRHCRDQITGGGKTHDWALNCFMISRKLQGGEGGGAGGWVSDASSAGLVRGCPTGWQRRQGPSHGLIRLLVPEKGLEGKQQARLPFKGGGRVPPPRDPPASSAHLS